MTAQDPVSGPVLPTPIDSFVAAVNAGDQQAFIGHLRTHSNGLSAFTFEVVGDKIQRMTIREG